MVARYTSQCYVCGDRIHVGQEITDVAVSQGNTWVHAQCASGLPRPPVRRSGPLAVLELEVERVLQSAR